MHSESFHQESSSNDRLKAYYHRATESLLRENDLDALLLFCRDNIRFFADFRVVEQLEFGGSIAEEYATIVNKDERVFIFEPWQPVAMRKASESAKGHDENKEWIYVPAWTPQGVVEEYWLGAVTKVLNSIGAKRVGYDSLSHSFFSRLDSEARYAFTPMFRKFLETRLVKQVEEINLLSDASKINDAALEAGLQIMKEGVSEHQVASEIARVVYDGGAESLSHINIASGPPKEHSLPTNRKLQNGDSVKTDIGVYGVGGYSADIARTGFVGVPPSSFMEGYKLLKETLDNTAKSLVPGRKASEIDQMLRKPLLDAGYAAAPYANGHGIGLRLMELPQIDEPKYLSKDYELRENMVLCLEPHSWLDGHATKLEDTVIVRPGGGLTLSKCSFLG